jgi:CheY-like chemotaxis protein
MSELQFTLKFPPKRILVVEDEPALQLIICKKLVDSGFTVLTAETVGAAQSILEAESEISVLWVDHYLADQHTGLELVETLFAKPLVHQPLIFVVSNSIDQHKIKRYYQAGVRQYYTKPSSSLNDIIAEIEQQLAHR